MPNRSPFTGADRSSSDPAESEAAASGELLRRTYDELRRLADAWLGRERPGQTIQATALVHEAYLRLIGPAGEARWDNQGHFFAAAAESMRRILIDRARAKGTRKRGGDRRRLLLETAALVSDDPPAELLDLDAALERLRAADARKAELVKLKFYAGLTTQQAAAALGVSLATAERDWSFARAWLLKELQQEGGILPTG